MTETAAEVRICVSCDYPIVPGEGAVRRWVSGKLRPAEHVRCAYAAMEKFQVRDDEFRSPRKED